MKLREYAGLDRLPVDTLTRQAVKTDLNHLAAVRRNLSSPDRLRILGPAMVARMRTQAKTLELRIANLRAGRKKLGFLPV